MYPVRVAAAALAVLLTLSIGAAGAPPATPLAVAAGPYTDSPVAVRSLPGVGDRPVPVTIWYPAISAGSPQPRTGPFPVVLYSHGLRSLPALHADLTSRWAAAGFVVVAPTYPHTSRDAPRFSRADVVNQPTDAWRVLHRLARLNADETDPLAGTLDLNRVAAAGHSAGGHTTTGMFTGGRFASGVLAEPPIRLVAAVVIAGRALGGAFRGPAARVLFVHGDADPIVPIGRARRAYAALRWPKGFLTLPGQGHGAYLGAGKPGFDVVLATTTDFLRWTLRDDAAARHRMSARGSVPGTSRFDEEW